MSEESKELILDTASKISRHKLLPDGSLLVWGRVARTGELDYNSHKQIVESDVLFATDSINSLVGKPITLEHPPSAISNLDERQKYAVGTVLQEIVKEQDDTGVEYLTAASLIWDKPVIKMILDGEISDLSAGYLVTKEKINDSTYRQVSREYNHIAITREGRAGKNVGLLTDSSVDIGHLVSLHVQFDNVLRDNGIEPKFDWTPLQLKTAVVKALTGKDIVLSEESCDSLIEVLSKQTAKIEPVVTPKVSNSDGLSNADLAEKLWVESISSAYDKIK